MDTTTWYGTPFAELRDDHLENCIRYMERRIEGVEEALARYGSEVPQMKRMQANLRAELRFRAKEATTQRIVAKARTAIITKEVMDRIPELVRELVAAEVRRAR